MRSALLLSIVALSTACGDPQLLDPEKEGELGTQSDALTGSYIIWLHGRSNSSWGSKGTVSASGWTNITLSYDGSARLATSSTTTVKNAINTYCTSPARCIVACHSAGCMRALKAIDDLHAAGIPLGGLMWVEASASAAGGSVFAVVTTDTGISEQPIDEDLRPEVARGTWATIQDGTGPSYMYHMAGTKTTCVWGILCGSIVLAGEDDGAVGFDSAAGYSSTGSFTNGCNTGKYPYRNWEPRVACSGTYRNHSEMGNYTADIVAADLGGTVIR